MSDSLWPHGLYSHGILQARILEWVAIPFSRGSSQTRDQTRSSTLQVDSLPVEPPGEPLSKSRLKLIDQSFIFYCEKVFLYTWKDLYSMTLEVESSTVLLLNSHHVHPSAFNFLCLKSVTTLPHILDIVPNPLYGLQDPPWSSMCLSRLISLFFHYSLCFHNLGILSTSKLFLSAYGIISLKTATRYQRQ